jgi:hypothetical protein
MSDQTPPPSGDQDPISGSQPPPTDPPPAAPVNPYETPAAPAAPAGQPQYGAPQYGDPQYGTPQYGTPGVPQPAMAGGYPAMPGMPGGAVDDPGKGMAIAALVSSLICCTPVGFVLALVVLRRSRDGRNHGKGLAIAALIISVLFSLGIALGAYGLSQVDWDDLNPVSSLSEGDCFNAEGLDDEDADFVTGITEVDCDDRHDAEVIASTDLTADQAEAYELDNSLCDQLVTEAGFAPTVDLGLTSLTVNDSPNAGDRLACVAYNLDGSKLDAPLQ